MNNILAAERRARAFLSQKEIHSGAVIAMDILDDPDGHALLAAARAAGCVGARAAVRLAEVAEATPVWDALVPGCRRFATVGEGTPTVSAARIVSGDSMSVPLSIPDEAAAWRISLAGSSPRVVRDNGTRAAVSCAASRDIDRAAIEEYGIPGICLMENAAVGAVTVAVDMLAGRKENGVAIVAGGGNNGGDGLAMARGFLSLGIPVQAALLKPSRLLGGDAAANYSLLRDTGIVVRELAAQPEYLESMLAGKDLIVDALLGTGFRGDLAPAFRDAIALMNAAGAAILAVDIPSGLNGDSGVPAEETVRAERTITFATVKTGLRGTEAGRYVGELYVGDIGIV